MAKTTTKIIDGMTVIHLGDLIVTVEESCTYSGYNGEIYDAEGHSDTQEELESFIGKIEDFEVEGLDGGNCETESENMAIDFFTNKEWLDSLRKQFLVKLVA